MKPARTLVALAIAASVACSGCLTYAAIHDYNGERMTRRQTAQALGAETAVGLLIGWAVTHCGDEEDDCPPGAGGDSAGEVGASLAWGVGGVFLFDAVLAGFALLLFYVYESDE